MLMTIKKKFSLNKSRKNINTLIRFLWPPLHGLAPWNLIWGEGRLHRLYSWLGLGAVLRDHSWSCSEDHMGSFRCHLLLSRRWGADRPQSKSSSLRVCKWVLFLLTFSHGKFNFAFLYKFIPISQSIHVCFGWVHFKRVLTSIWFPN